MISADEIYALFLMRQRRLAPLHAKLVQVRDICGGDIILPLPELDEVDRPAVANLLLQDVEQKGARVASTFPTVKYPPLRWGIKRSMELARQRGLITDAWYDLNKMTLKMQQRAKHAVAYAMSPVLVRPGKAVHDNRQVGIPVWEVRDPITTYPPEMAAGDLVPPDVIFSYLRSAAWVKERFPSAFADRRLFTSKLDKPIRILQYCDDTSFVTLALGESNQQPGIPQIFGDQPVGGAVPVELERIDNRVGRCLAVVPGRLGLDRFQGELEGVIGMYLQLAKLMALETIGAQRDIWPETWAVSHPNDQVDIIAMADPLRGQVGKIKGGVMTFMQRNASQSGLNLIDRLERGVRVEASIPAELGGESSTNIRTGRRGDAVLAAAIDFPLQMIHQMFEASITEENKLAIAIDKAYFNTAKSFFVSATDGTVSYTPSVLWETDVNFVQYSQAGVDAQALTINVGQMVGAGLMSRRGAMEMHPFIDDPEEENDRITSERLTDAMLQAIQTRAASDPTFVKPLARIIDAVLTDRLELAEAYTQVDAEVQAEQAAAQAQGPAAQPGPEGQPGLGQLPAQIPQPQPSVDNLSRLLREIRPRNQSPAPPP